MPVRVASRQRELEQVIEEMNDGGERDGLLDWKKQLKAGNSSVPNPNPEKNVKADASNDTMPMIK